MRTTRISRRTAGIVGLVAVGTFAAACGSDASSDDAGADAGTATGDTTAADGSTGDGAAPTGGSISVMIAASGPAETAAVQAAVDGWQTESGNTVELIAAEDINLQLGQALAGGEPPDVFYVNADKFQEYASGGSLAAIGSTAREPRRLLRITSAGIHLRRRVVLRTKGLLDARADHQQRVVGGSGPRRHRHPHHVGGTRHRGRDPHHREPGGSGNRCDA